MNTKETLPKPKNLALVAYHADCTDGFTSCWVTVRALQKIGYKTATLGMYYTPAGTEKLVAALKKYKFAKLIVVDFSLDINTLARLEHHFPHTKTTIIDHHKTAFERYSPEMEVLKYSTLGTKIHGATIELDNNESGASLCWKYFNMDIPQPKLIKYVRDYDLWRFDEGLATKYANKYIALQKKTLDNWDMLAYKFDDPANLGLIMDAGEQLQREHNKEVEKITMLYRSCLIESWEGVCVKCPYEYVSDVGHLLANVLHTYGLMYQVDEKKKEVKFSLRSSGEYDVTLIAKKFGGGGHKNAAGFTLPLEKARILLGGEL